MNQCPRNKTVCFVSIHTVFLFTVKHLLISGIIANMNVDKSKLSSMIALSSRMLLNFPLTGYQIRMWGVQSVNKKNLTRLMEQKKDIGIVPGGF